MTVSILTPSYNYGRFIQDTIDSVEAQDADIEHLVVDGASVDDTVEKLRDASSSRLRWVSEPDRGMSDALNKALAMATGEWIALLNADEFLLPGAVDAVLNDASAFPQASVIFGDAAFVDEDARFDRLFSLYPVSPRVVRWYGCTLLSCSVFIRRSILPRGGWDVGLKRNNDWDMWLQLLGGRGNFHHIARSLSAYRVHPARLTDGPAPLLGPEAQQVRSRHGIPTHPLAVRVLHSVGKIDHGLHKFRARCYDKERQLRRLFRGADMRWFASRQACDEVQSLLRSEAAGR